MAHVVAGDSVVRNRPRHPYCLRYKPHQQSLRNPALQPAEATREVQRPGRRTGSRPGSASTASAGVRTQRLQPGGRIVEMHRRALAGFMQRAAAMKAWPVAAPHDRHVAQMDKIINAQPEQERRQRQPRRGNGEIGQRPAASIKSI